MIIILLVIIALIVAVYLFMQQPKFGKVSSGSRLERIKNSPNYKDSKFHNLSYTPDLTEGVSYYKVMKEFFFEKSKRLKPAEVLPSVKINLTALNPEENIFVWFGHSSYFMQIDGKKILVDPVMSGSASPIAFTATAYKGSDVYTTSDIPEIDYLFITHDHWDHLDYKTITALKPKIKKVICGLGTAAHLEYWGYDILIINELDWNEEVVLDNSFTVNTASSRHFSGRGFKRNQSLWMSYILKTPTMKVYIGGDSGYDSHFEKIGNLYGPFELAILECGQYNKNWKYIHMMPEEVVKAAQDLKAAKTIPVHWSKFSLGQHAWDEPITRVTNEAKEKNIILLHPMIGEGVNLKEVKKFSQWWEGIN